MCTDPEITGDSSSAQPLGLLIRRGSCDNQKKVDSLDPARQIGAPVADSVDVE